MGSRQRPKEAHRTRPNEICRPETSERELTLELLKELPDAWETAMSYPLPPNPSYELLEAARLNVLDFLNFNSGFTGRTKEQIAKTLQRGLDKLLEISVLLQDVTHKPPPDDGIPF